MSLKPAIAYSEMTKRWYFVTAWKKEGQAKTKFDITDQMEEIIAGVAEQAEEPLKQAIDSHFTEVYGGENPNFCWDIELYQAAGLLPEDYVHPTEDDMAGTVYGYRKLLEETVERLEYHIGSANVVNYARDIQLLKKAKEVLNGRNREAENPEQQGKG